MKQVQQYCATPEAAAYVRPEALAAVRKVAAKAVYNYRYPMILFTGFGLLGLLFAFLSYNFV